MQYLLSRASHLILKRLAEERTLCAFDFDGTLSPIVRQPAKARMRTRTRNLLSRLAGLYPCVIISGRAREDIVCKLSGAKVARVIGNHGAEADATIRQSCSPVERWKVALELELGSLSGISVEDKGFSLAVHYRQSRRRTEAKRRILAATGKLKQVRVFGGKEVVNLVVDSSPNKGEALAAERNLMRCNWVLYVGDDENDEDAFALKGNIIPVRIGQKRSSHARYYLRKQAEIDRLLKELVLLRTSCDDSGPQWESQP